MKQETTKEKIIRKLTSRKLWVAICAFVALILVACGWTEADAAKITLHHRRRHGGRGGRP